jgi:3-hydroxyisobutyrate dehydrogenase-like beta-hydroxyacid dehydrogenase
VEIGFIGLGNIGGPIAGRLAEAGTELVVFDLDRARMEPLLAAGARAADSVADVAGRAETVLTSLPNPAALEAVALGADGLTAGDRVRRLVDLSTVGPEVSRRVAAGLAEHSIALVDAPVSGGAAGAEKGTLAVMVAGAAAEREAVERLLTHLGRPIAVGEEPGLGQVTKLLNNYLAATALAATSEAFVYGVKSGLDPEVMVDVVNAASGRNSASQDKFPRSILPGTFDYGFATGLMAKDIGLFLADAEAQGVPLWVGSAVREVWRFAADQLGPDSDFTEVVRPFEQWVGVEVRAQRG